MLGCKGLRPTSIMVPDLVKFIAMVFARRRTIENKTQLTQVKENVTIIDFPFKSLLTCHITCKKQLYALVKDKDTLQ